MFVSLMMKTNYCRNVTWVIYNFGAHRACKVIIIMLRLLKLPILASEVVAAIPNETLPPDATLVDPTVDPPMLGEKQRTRRVV